MELKTKTFVFIIASFLLGGVAGVFVGRTYFASQQNGHRQSKAQVRGRFAERLQLNPMQKFQVDSIFEAFRQKFGEVQKQYWQTVHMKRDTLRLAIKRILTDEQNKLYDEFLREHSELEGRRRESDDR